jgi:hypothetical protein
MADWRIDNAKCTRGAVLHFKKYTRYREGWDHFFSLPLVVESPSAPAHQQKNKKHSHSNQQPRPSVRAGGNNDTHRSQNLWQVRVVPQRRHFKLSTENAYEKGFQKFEEEGRIPRSIELNILDLRSLETFRS